MQLGLEGSLTYLERGLLGGCGGRRVGGGGLAMGGGKTGGALGPEIEKLRREGQRLNSGE